LRKLLLLLPCYICGFYGSYIRDPSSFIETEKVLLNEVVRERQLYFTEMTENLIKSTTYVY